MGWSFWFISGTCSKEVHADTRENSSTETKVLHELEGHSMPAQKRGDETYPDARQEEIEEAITGSSQHMKKNCFASPYIARFVQTLLRRRARIGARLDVPALNGNVDAGKHRTRIEID